MMTGRWTTATPYGFPLDVATDGRTVANAQTATGQFNGHDEVHAA